MKNTENNKYKKIITMIFIIQYVAYVANYMYHCFQCQVIDAAIMYALKITTFQTFC